MNLNSQRWSRAAGHLGNVGQDVFRPTAIVAETISETQSRESEVKMTCLLNNQEMP